mmetsp:Transcript_18206/g.54915  ORF Transcript_18206/g.54915 Transcript_18206/m.54915 type:complete len:263 (+) Transcript_18206:574-1362(+)
MQAPTQLLIPRRVRPPSTVHVALGGSRRLVVSLSLEDAMPCSSATPGARRASMWPASWRTGSTGPCGPRCDGCCSTSFLPHDFSFYTTRTASPTLRETCIRSTPGESSASCASCSHLHHPQVNLQRPLDVLPPAAPPAVLLRLTALYQPLRFLLSAAGGATCCMTYLHTRLDRPQTSRRSRLSHSAARTTHPTSPSLSPWLVGCLRAHQLRQSPSLLWSNVPMAPIPPCSRTGPRRTLASRLGRTPPLGVLPEPYCTQLSRC